MNRFFSFLSACIVSTFLYAAPINVPTVADVAATHDPINNVILCCYFDEEVCNDVVFVGNYNNWSNDPSQCLTFAALPNYNGWYVAEIPWSLGTNGDGSTFAPYGKPVQLKNDGSFDWEYQTGDTGAWINLGGVGAQTVNLSAGYNGEADVSYPAPGVYIYEIAYWKKHQVPCIPVPAHNYTIRLYAPACESNPGYKPAIIGHFNNWETGVAMTEGTDANSKKYYTYTLHDEEGQPIKFREATDTDWSNQFQYYDASTDEWKIFDNISLPAATKDTTLVFDWSNTDDYRYSLCADIDVTDNLFWPLWMNESDMQKYSDKMGYSFCVNFDDRNFYIWDETYAAQFEDGLSLVVADKSWAGAGFNVANGSTSYTQAEALLQQIKAHPDKFHLHFSIRSTDNVSVSFQVFSSVIAFTLGTTTQYDAPVYGDFNRNGQWQTIDIPMSHWTTEWSSATFDGNILSVLTEAVSGAQIDLNDVYFYSNQIPFSPVPAHNYTIRLYAPACESNPDYKPAIIGHFNNWETGVAMTEGTDANSKKYYTYTLHDEEGQPIKFREATDTDWSNQFQYYDASNEEWKIFDNISLPAATKDTTLVFDWSNTEEYSYTLCEKYDPYEITVYFKAPIYSPDTIAIYVEIGSGVELPMTYDEEKDIWSATITLNKNWMALGTGVRFYDWNNPQNWLYICESPDKYLTWSFYFPYAINIEHFMTFDENGNRYAYIDCSDNLRYQWSGRFRTYHEHLLYLCDRESKTATVIDYGNYYMGYDHDYEIEGLGDLVIPDSIVIYTSQNEETGYTVNGIANSVFFDCNTLTSVVIPNSVTSIGDGAFEYCSNLRSVTFPESLTHIGNSAFDGCSNLGSVTLPGSLTHIGNYAFGYCSQLTIITCPEDVEEIGSYCFYYCTNLKEVYIPATCALIILEHYDPYDYDPSDYGSPILGCPAIEKITAPAYCFNNIYESYYPSSAKNIQEMHVNAGVLDANGWDFIKRSNKTLRTLDLSALENTVMDDEALDECFKLTSLQLPSSCEHIGYKAMAECVMLKSINIPSSVVEIGDRAFEDCRSIESIVFGDVQAANAPSRSDAPVSAGHQLKRIGNWAFYNAHELQNLNIPEGVEEIGDAAFYGCVYLEEMTLPSSVHTIGDNTFALCSKLKKITCNAAAPPAIRAKTFYDVKRQTPVYVPEEAVAAYKADTYWREFDIQGRNNMPSAVEQITNNQSKTADKVIKDGQILILRGEKVYTLQGQEIK